MLNDLFQQYRPTLQIIGISSDKEAGAHDLARQKHQITWPSQLDQPLEDGRTIGEHYQAASLPFYVYVLVEADGRITQISARLEEIKLWLEKK